MKYFKEQEQKRLEEKYTKWQKQKINKASNNIQNSIRQIRCKRMFNCFNKDTQFCMSCNYNMTKPFGTPSMDNYKEKIPGMKYF